MTRARVRFRAGHAVPLAAVLLAGCDSPASPTPPPPPQFNSAPVIQSVVASVTSRTEVDTNVTVTATVTDAETPVDALNFVWTATVGTITGTGRNVAWRLPKGAAATPQDVTIAVAILEPYQTRENGVLINRLHRVEGAAAPFRVHDSPGEVEAISMGFLENFADNAASPEFCVKDFSDSCAGKEAELEQIEGVRRGRIVTDSTLALRSITFNGALTTADVEIDCRFDSTVIAKIDSNDPFSPGDSVVAEGLCVMQVIYENGLWKLCLSLFFGSELSAAGVEAVEPRRSVARALFGYGR
jgi:hypothetical protein